MYQILVYKWKGGCGATTIAYVIAIVLDGDVIEHDLQGTLRVAAEHTGKLMPTTLEKVTKDVVIHDTPPYNASKIKSIAREVDLILLPCKLNYPDFLTFVPLYNSLKKEGLLNKSVVVFNEVRKTLSKSNAEMRRLYKKNCADIRYAKTEFSSLAGFAKVLAEPLTGEALAQTNQLIKELNLKRS